MGGGGSVMTFLFRDSSSWRSSFMAETMTQALHPHRTFIGRLWNFYTCRLWSLLPLILF